MNYAKTLSMDLLVTRPSTRPTANNAREPLATERQFFQENHRELSLKYSGMFVLVKGEKVVGLYDDARTAYREGSRRFGWDPFLVQQI